MNEKTLLELVPIYFHCLGGTAGTVLLFVCFLDCEPSPLIHQHEVEQIMNFHFGGELFLEEAGLQA